MSQKSTDMEKLSTLIELVSDGGMEHLKELPGQEKIKLKDKYFDRFTTYMPHNWLGSRRLTKKELEDFVGRTYSGI